MTSTMYEGCSSLTIIASDAFCFICIVQWSEITQTCPICKASFQAVIHNVKNFDDYTTVRIQQPPLLLHGGTDTCTLH